MKKRSFTARKPQALIKVGLVALCAGSIALSGCGAAATSAGSSSNSGSSAATSTVSSTLVEKLSFDATEQPEPTKSVVYLSGSWHDMGVQFAEQATEALKREVSEGIADAVATYGWDGAKEEEQDYLTYYEEHAPELVELYQGMAEGLDIDYEDFMVGMISYVTEESTDEADEERAADTCSNMAAWGSQTEDNKLIVGADWDSNGTTAYYMPTVVAFPDDGNAFISESGFQGNLVMSSKGLVVAGSSGQNAEDGDCGMGIPVMTSQWLLGATCDNATEAKDAYLGGLTPTTGDNANLNDTDGNHYLVEATVAHNATREPGDFGETDYLIATNDFMTDEMQSSLLPKGSGYDDCRPRYYTEEQILLQDTGKVTTRTLANALGSTSYYDGSTWTTDNWNAETGLNSPEAVSPMYQNIMKAICVPEDGAYYVMNGCSNQEVSLLPNARGTYVKITLTESAADSNSAARDTANSLIYSAGSVIDHATDDTTDAKASLNEAKEALNEGDGYTTQAGLVSGTEAQALLSKATSAYLRAQDLAQAAIGDNQAVLDL